jgi:hypothetical protein
MAIFQNMLGNLGIGGIGLIVLVIAMLLIKLPDGETSILMYLIKKITGGFTPEDKRLRDVESQAREKEEVEILREDIDEMCHTVGVEPTDNMRDLMAVSTAMQTGSRRRQRGILDFFDFSGILDKLKGMLPIILIGAVLAFMAFGGIGGCGILEGCSPMEGCSPK